MCELMGLCFARPISASFTIREFARRDVENADGWGLGWYPDQSVAIIKEPIRWQDSTLTTFLETYQHLRSPLYIAHVRRKTVGGPPTHADTHPFKRELNGREYCFAHNGTVLGLQQMPLQRYHPVGSTDSELLFCHLLDDLARRSEPLEDEAGWRWLHDKLSSLNRLGKLNCLLSDGRRLFCYHDVAGHKGLTLRSLDVAESESRHLEDGELRIDLERQTSSHGFVVATQPLSLSPGWQPLQHGELIVLEDGVLRFSSHRSVLAPSLVPAARSDKRVG